MQTADPGTFEKVPVKQGSQEEEEGFELYVPTGQAEQDDDPENKLKYPRPHSLQKLEPV